MVAALPTIYSKPDSPLYFSPGKLRASKARKNVHAVAQAVMKVMAREMGDRALQRLPEMFDDELGETLFGGVGVKPPKITRRQRRRHLPVHLRLFAPPQRRCVIRLGCIAFQHALWYSPACCIEDRPHSDSEATASGVGKV